MYMSACVAVALSSTTSLLSQIMPLRASQWAPKRELQNAKFESYKLSFDDDEDERIHCIKFARDGALPGRMLAAGPASDLRLGYKDARNRAEWNHLAAGQNGAVAWIDREGVFWLAELSQVGFMQSSALAFARRSFLIHVWL